MLETPVRNGSELEGASRGLSRRQLVKAGVWAAPVVVLATATPAMAASTGAIVVTSITGTTTGGGSNHTHTATVTVSNSSDTTVVVTVSLTATQVASGPTPNTVTLSVPANGSASVGSIVLTTANNGGGKTLTATPSLSGNPAGWTFQPMTVNFKGSGPIPS